MALRDGILIVGYASGHIRIFHADDDPAECGLEVEIAAHARNITAIDMHPGQYTVRACA